jgi:nucleoside-diphosphate-sugar epimerase
LAVLFCLSPQDADNSPRNFSLADVHVEGTERIVDAVAKYDVDRYIHVSSHSADPESISEFYATKVSYAIRHQNSCAS